MQKWQKPKWQVDKMRIDVKKFLFVGHDEDKAAFFEEAQKIGVIQFKEGTKGGLSPDVQVYTDAIKVLRGEPLLDQKEEGSSYDIAREIVSLKHKIDKFEEEIRIAKLEYERIVIYGNFSLEDIAYFKKKGVFLQFFTAKKRANPDLIYIDSSHGLDYFIAINRAPTTYPGMIEIQIEENLDDLRARLKNLESQRDQIEKKLKGMAAYNHLLHANLIDALNKAHLNEAKNEALYPIKEPLFYATGWVPEDKVAWLTKLPVFSEEIAIEKTDVVPTYLENENIARIGEDVIGIYDTPSNQDKDPSLWVLFGFIVFFSMIIGDGGYGSVYFGLTLYLRYKYPLLKGLKKRILNLATYLSIGCMIWGILTSSFFGISVSPESPVRNFSFTHYLAKEKAAYLNKALTPELTDQILLELALLIGVVHLILGLLRYLKKNPGNIGWIAFLVGSYLYFPVFLGAPSILNYLFGIPFEAGGVVGLYLIGLGITSAIGISIYRNGLIGLAEVMTVIQVFADVLSYLRLYALGLSGSILSSTINSMASHMPFVIAVILIVFGHIINMLLGIMGGVIHGLRLNFLEWYHYSFEGGGRKFKPLEIKE